MFDIDLTSEFHQLDDGTVEDRPSMRESFPAIFAADETSNLGALGLGLRWDTRDSQSNPYGGWHAGAGVDTAFAQTGGAVGAVFSFSGGHVILVPGLFHDGGDEGESHPPTDVIALEVFSRATAGQLPFFWQPSLGGSQTQRGYIDGRWRDRAAWHGAAEYRFWVIPRGFPVTRNVRIERVGLAAFYELGSVAGDWPALAHARLAHSYGTGVRISLERVTIFRIDIGFSEEGHNVTIGFGLSF